MVPIVSINDDMVFEFLEMPRPEKPFAPSRKDFGDWTIGQAGSKKWTRKARMTYTFT
jgi:hypothetical protein